MILDTLESTDPYNEMKKHVFFLQDLLFGRPPLQGLSSKKYRSHGPVIQATKTMIIDSVDMFRDPLGHTIEHVIVLVGPQNIP